MAAPRSPLLAAMLLLLSLLLGAVGSRAETSVVFVDGASQRYLRGDATEEHLNSITSEEIAASASVLLGFAPSVANSADISAKLNEVLLPNPFDKPHAVFLLEVDGSTDAPSVIANSNAKVSNARKYKITDASQTTLQLPGEDEVHIVRADEDLDSEYASASLDEELDNLAKWLGGSYIRDLETKSGKLSILLPSGRTLELHTEKEAELQFALSLSSLLRIVNRGEMIHETFSGSIASPAEFVTVHLKGIKSLKEHSSQDVIEKGMEVFQIALTKSVESLQRAHEGKIVTILISKDVDYQGAMVDVNSASRVSRWLQQDAPDYSTVAATVLVRQSLLWITGILLLVSTIIGVCLLMNMPLTKDTLLYSNVKLD